MERFSHLLDDSLCVGQRQPKIDKDERVLLFLKMREGEKFTDRLKRKVKEAIRSALSARHVPAHIFEVSDIPVRCLLSNASIMMILIHLDICSIRSITRR